MKSAFAAPIALCSFFFLVPSSPVLNRKSELPATIPSNHSLTLASSGGNYLANNSTTTAFYKDVLLTLEDERTSLSEFIEKSKGKLIYVDFWASWCGPCRGEMPSSRKIKETYKDKDVVFLYLSLDSRVEAWKKGSEQENLATTDNNYLLESAQGSDIVKKLKINSIPRYVLFDRKGKIVNNDAPRPSDPKLITLLNKELTKK